MRLLLPIGLPTPFQLSQPLACMTIKTVSVGDNFACTVGLAVFSGVAGTAELHSHWAHQIVVDLDGQIMECFCDEQWFSSAGVFVPSGHSHQVDPGNQISLFFDSEITWIAEAFGGKLDTSCACVLDEDVLLGVRSCFQNKMTLKEGLQIIAEAFELRILSKLGSEKLQRWQTLVDKAEQVGRSADLTSDQQYSQIGALFAEHAA